MLPSDSISLIEHRIKTLEDRQDELRTKEIPELLAHGKAWHASLMTILTSLQSSLVQLQTDLPTHYSPRPESEERHRGVDRRFDELETELEKVLRDHTQLHKDLRDDIRELREDNKKLVGGIAAALLSAAMAFAQALFKVFPNIR